MRGLTKGKNECTVVTLVLNPLYWVKNSICNRTSSWWAQISTTYVKNTGRVILFSTWIFTVEQISSPSCPLSDMSNELLMCVLRIFIRHILWKLVAFLRFLVLLQKLLASWCALSLCEVRIVGNFLMRLRQTSRWRFVIDWRYIYLCPTLAKCSISNQNWGSDIKTSGCKVNWHV
jgi:hypothetical protein